ncbi:hypothetical protein [Streptomyces aureus]|uniref:hypothetical protein n=1 Tax=Streptomyces aureus TaxID=193461 RepID=UPI003FD72BFE
MTEEAGLRPRLHATPLSELRRADLMGLDDCAVDGPQIRILKGGAIGPSPADRARPGSKHHRIVDRHGTPLAVTPPPAGSSRPGAFQGGSGISVTRSLPPSCAVHAADMVWAH